MALIEVIEIANPFEPSKRERKELCYMGSALPFYVETEERDIVLNGHIVENPATIVPVNGDQIIVMPHVGGKGLKRVFGVVAMIGLSLYAGSIAGGLWKGLGSAFAAGHAGALLASGAVMFLGGKLINSIFPQTAGMNYNEQETSQSYGWDLPTPVTTAGTVVGETYGECIPQPQLLEQHVETVNDEQYLNLLYCGGYGPVDSIDKIRIDYTDISNFSNVQLETRLGTNEQEPISFFKNTPLDQSVGLELDTETPLIRTTDSTKASSLEITMEWPAGLYRVNDSGNYEKATVTFRAEYRKTGETAWTNFNADGSDYSVTEGTNEAIRRTFLVSGIEAAQYDVRVTLLDRPTTSRYQSMTQWSILTSYSDGIYSRPNKVLVAMRIKATNQLSSGVPSVNWRQTRKTVLVHNPDTGDYEEKAADNPIWATYDILHGCRKLKNVNTGEYEYVVAGYPASCLDAYYDQWEDAAAYADEEIVNQDGETEARFRFDAYFDTEMKRWNAAQKAANIGHAVIIPHGRNIGIVVDKPGKITQVFGEGRTTVSSVKGSFSAKEDRAKSVEITYSDANNDFKNTVMTVRSPKYSLDSSSDNTAQLTLFGVKRRSQAYREAVTTLATNERQLQFIELGADIDAIVAEYGDIVGFNHAVSRIGIASGRIVSATATTITIDRSVTLEASKSYEIYITLSDDTLLKKEIVSADGTTDTFTVTDAFDASAIPVKYDNYAFGEVDKAVKPFRIVGAKRDGDFKVTLSLAEYDEAMYSTELDYSKYPVIDYTTTPTVMEIESVTAIEQSYVSGNASISDIAVSWTLSADGTPPDSYTIEIESENSAYHERISSRLTNCLFHNVRAGELYTITVYTVLDGVTLGGKSTTVQVSGRAIPEGTENIRGLVIARTHGGFNLFWSAGTDPDIAGYTIYQGTYPSEMNDCTAISEKQADVTCFVKASAAGRYQFYVIAVDETGKQAGTPLSGMGEIALPGAVTDAKARTQYRYYSDGTTGYDIIATFSLPDGAATAEAWYKTNHADMTTVTGAIPEGVAGDEIGYESDWRYAGDGAEKITIPAAQLGDTYKVKLLAKDADGFTSAESDAVTLTVEVVAKTEVPNTPQNFQYDFSLASGFRFTWDDVTNTDVDFYELRYDQNVGTAANLITRVQGANATLTKLSKRSATIYLYAHNTTKRYSLPASLTYSYRVLDAPAGLTFTDAPRAVIIKVPGLIDSADGIRLYIEGNPIDLGKNTRYTYAAEPGIYMVTACYYDVFGEGKMSTEYQATIKPTFDESWIADESISLSKVDKTVQQAVEDAQTAIPRLDGLDKDIVELRKTDSELSSTIQQNKSDTDTAISKVDQKADSISSTVQSQKKELDGTISGMSSQITQNSDKITSVVTNLGSVDAAGKAGYSAITQLQDGINLRVKSSDFTGANIVSQINVSPDGTTIDGKYLHVTGTTKFDKDVIVGGMIAAGAITADKLSSSTISLTQNQGIKGGSVTLNAEGMTVVKDSGGGVRFDSSGMQFFDKNNKIYTTTGRIIVGTIQDGQVLTLNSAWDNTPYIIMSPLEISNKLQNITYANADMLTQCYPINVSKNGFTGRCRTVASNASAHISKGVSRDRTVTIKASTEEFTSATIAIGNTASCSNDDDKRNISVTTKIYVDGVEKLALTSTHSFWQVYYGGGYSSPSAIHLKSADNDQYAGSLTFAKNSVITATVAATGDYIADAGANVSMDLHVDETVVSTGTAMFIAVETPNQGYTLR